MKIVLAGSPKIAVEAFEKVINNFDVVAIITQPDRPQGRGMKMQETDVAELGRRYQLPVYKPEKVGEIYEELKALDYDILLTFAFGQFIPERILNLGKFKPMNIHGSLLPKYRGAAPIHYAILNGDKEIGITLIEMTKQMDAGDMYFKASRKISDQTTTGEAFEIISELAAENIVSWLRDIEMGEVIKTPQGDDFTLSPKIEKEFAQLTNELTTHQALRRIKGLNPFPGAFTLIEARRLKVFNAQEQELPNSIELNFANGKLYATEYQWEGKNKVKL